MASEMINSVIAAEKSGEQALADATAKADEMKNSAILKASQEQDNARAEALKKAKSIRAAAENQAEQIRNDAVNEAKSQAATVKDAALVRSGIAVSRLIKEITG